jgi:serine/threonine-protein kinase
VPSIAGTKLDKYDILEEVGHGGMAVVYRAYDTVLKREVAVKVLHPHLSGREESRLRLQREAIAVAKLRHENILEIFDYSGPQAPESYIVTEFIHGPTLREWIDDSLEPRPAVAAMVVHRLCLALSQAHRSGIVHRDIKPENVMIRSDDGCIKLMDFGIAQILDNQKLTLTGQLIGSPAYMAPELISGRPLDARTDLFSLGILLYQLATGALPFAGRNPHEVLNRIADGDYPAPSTVCPLVDRELEEIIARALATDPDDRYQSVDSFAKELEHYLEEVGLEPVPAEFVAYFHNPSSYVIELDGRVCHALMERAAEAASAGHSARAIRVLGRVLEIDGSHAAARAMLARLRTRERRLRQMLLGAGVVAVGGLVAAGFMLVPAGSEHMEAHTARAGSPRPSVPRPRAADLEPDHSDDAAPSDAAPTGTTTTVPGSSEGAASDANGSEGAIDPTPRIRRPPPQRTVPTDVECTLRFTVIPASTTKGKVVRVGREVYTLDGPRLQISFQGARARVFFDDRKWLGGRDVSRAECEAGEVAIPVRPAPATIQLQNAPALAAVICTRGCAKSDLNQNRSPEQLQIPVQGTSVSVELTIKAENHHDAHVRETLYPGPNLVSVTLPPKPEGK